MNLSESMRYVLKNRGTELLSDFWKEDLTNLVRESYHDVRDLKRRSTKKILSGEWKDSLRESYHIIKVIPKRVNTGIGFLREDLALAFERQKDNGERTRFTLQVFRELLLFSLSAVGSVHSGGSRYLGLGPKRSPFTHLLMARLIYKLSRRFILRFLDEVEGQMDRAEEKDQLRGFRKVLLDESQLDFQKMVEGFAGEDEARVIVNNFKNYIQTGERGSSWKT